MELLGGAEAIERELREDDEEATALDRPVTPLNVESVNAVPLSPYEVVQDIRANTFGIAVQAEGERSDGLDQGELNIVTTNPMLTMTGDDKPSRY